MGHLIGSWVTRVRNLPRTTHSPAATSLWSIIAPEASVKSIKLSIIIIIRSLPSFRRQFGGGERGSKGGWVSPKLGQSIAEGDSAVQLNDQVQRGKENRNIPPLKPMETTVRVHLMEDLWYGHMPTLQWFRVLGAVNRHRSFKSGRT